MEQTLILSQKKVYKRDLIRIKKVSLISKMGLITVFIVAINIIRVVHAVDGIKYVEGSINKYSPSLHSMQDYLEEETIVADDSSRDVNRKNFDENNE